MSYFQYFFFLCSLSYVIVNWISWALNCWLDKTRDLKTYCSLGLLWMDGYLFLCLLIFVFICEIWNSFPKYSNKKSWREREKRKHDGGKSSSGWTTLQVNTHQASLRFKGSSLRKKSVKLKAFALSSPGCEPRACSGQRWGAHSNGPGSRAAAFVARPEQGEAAWAG